MVAVVYQRMFLFCIIVSCALQVDAQVLPKHAEDQFDSVAGTSERYTEESDEAVTHPEEEDYGTTEVLLREARSGNTPDYCHQEGQTCGFQPYVSHGDGSYYIDPEEFVPYCRRGCIGYDCIRVGPPNMRMKVFRHLCKPRGWVPIPRSSMRKIQDTPPVSRRSGSIVDEL